MLMVLCLLLAGNMPSDLLWPRVGRKSTLLSIVIRFSSLSTTIFHGKRLTGNDEFSDAQPDVRLM